MPKDFSRTERVGEAIQRELAELIQREIKDPRLPGMITVSAVSVTRDFSYAKVYITVLGKEDAVGDALEILNHAAGYLRSQLARRIKLRTTPELTFVYDESISYGQRLSALIDSVTPEDESDEN